MFLAPQTTRPALRRLATLTALACTALALNGCGGGDRAKAYQPTRMVSFGDENSLIDTYTDANLFGANTGSAGVLKGLVYTINTMVATTNSYVCNTANVATPYTAATVCDSGNGSTSLTFAKADSRQGFVLPASANVMVDVQNDNTNQTLRVVDQTWSCTGAVIWTQVVAHAFRLGYASYNGAVGQCPTDAFSNAVSHAAYRAKSADVLNQINSHLGELGKGTLVTLMAGQWDILELYDQVKAGSKTQAAAEAELTARAEALANGVQAVVNTGAKVIVALTPDLGESPKAYSAADTALLKALTTTFNNGLYIDNLARRMSGRDVAGVNPETLTNTTTRASGYTYGTAACPAVDSNDATASTASTVQLKDPLGNAITTATSGYDANAAVKHCNIATSTLPTNFSTYMWADAIHFSPTGHSLIGSSAYSRASNQF